MMATPLGILLVSLVWISVPSRASFCSLILSLLTLNGMSSTSNWSFWYSGLIMSFSPSVFVGVRFLKVIMPCSCAMCLSLGVISIVVSSACICLFISSVFIRLTSRLIIILLPIASAVSSSLWYIGFLRMLP